MAVSGAELTLKYQSLTYAPDGKLFRTFIVSCTWFGTTVSLKIAVAKTVFEPGDPGATPEKAPAVVKSISNIAAWAVPIADKRPSVANAPASFIFLKLFFIISPLKNENPAQQKLFNSLPATILFR